MVAFSKSTRYNESPQSIHFGESDTPRTTTQVQHSHLGFVNVDHYMWDLIEHTLKAEVERIPNKCNFIRRNTIQAGEMPKALRGSSGTATLQREKSALTAYTNWHDIIPPRFYHYQICSEQPPHGALSMEQLRSWQSSVSTRLHLITDKQLSPLLAALGNKVPLVFINHIKIWGEKREARRGWFVLPMQPSAEPSQQLQRVLSSSLSFACPVDDGE